MTDRLPKLRQSIDALDQKLLEVLLERRRLVQDVVACKAERGIDLRNRAREDDVIAKAVRRGHELGMDAGFVTRVFREVIADAVRLQTEALQDRVDPSRTEAGTIRVAFQGVEEAYSHLAGQRYFAWGGDRVAFLGVPTFSEVVARVETGDVRYGFLPIENTTAGSINEVYDLLQRTRLSIVGEQVHTVVHCLLALPGGSLPELQRVVSHPQALAQCSDFLATLTGCRVEAFTDTAMAVEKVCADGDPSQAAVASQEAGRRHGLVVLKRGIANQRENLTRFVVVAKEPAQVDPRVPAKISLLLSTAHREGALARCLDLLARHHLNLCKLESRPKPREPWEYVFYVDVEGNLADPATREALEELRLETRYLQILGNYPAWDRVRGAGGGADEPAPVKDEAPDLP